MRLKRALLVLLAVFIAATAALATGLRSGLSLGFANNYLETRASEYLNRPLTLAAAPRLQLKSGLHIALGDITLANPRWAGKDPMLEIGAVEAQIDFWSLFGQQIIVERFDVNGVKLRLRRSADGRSNLPASFESQPEETAKASKPGPLPVAFKHINIRKVQINRTNEETARSVDLIIERLDQSAPDPGTLRVDGAGTLQGRPWQLSVDNSGFQSVQTGRNISGNVRAELGKLLLQGDYQIPNLAELTNLKLHAQLSGPIPPRIAELSPLLKAGEAADILLDVRDAAPGLEIDLSAELPHLKGRAAGTVDDPLVGDGLDLAILLDADSLPRLTKALGLGQGAEVPISLQGRLLRRGDHVELRDGVLNAGDNEIDANLVLPEFPGTDGARVKISASGPDFAFYQRLLEQTPTLEGPYSVEIDIDNKAPRGERLSGRLTVGAHQLHLSGVLDNFPSYAGSALKLELVSPSLQTLAATAGIEAPDTGVKVSSELSVSEDAMIVIQSANIVAYETTATITGSLNSYPDFDSANLHLSADVQSLARLGQQFGLQPLGDLPVHIETDVWGGPDRVLLGKPLLEAGGLKISATSGSLRYQEGALYSDLMLRGELSEVSTLLGDYAPDYLPKGSYYFDLSPKLSTELVSVALDNLSGPGLSGSARLELSRDLTLDDKTLLQAELHFSDLTQLLPDIEGYKPAEHALTLNAVTRPAREAVRISAQLLDGESPLLSTEISIALKSDDEGIRITVNGAGDDIGRLGRAEVLPKERLSYEVDAEVTYREDTVSIDAHKLSLGGSTVLGRAEWDRAGRALTAKLQVPNGGLDSWMSDSAPEDSKSPPSSSSDGRRIPKVELPLRWLHDYRIDLSVETQDLGLSDPRFSEESLVKQALFRLQSGDGKAVLNIPKLEGSRGEITGALEIDDSNESARLSGEMNVSGLPIGVIAVGSLYDALPRYNINSTFEARGDNLRSIAASLDGEFLMVGGPGYLQKIKFSAATESFGAQLFQTLLPMFAKGSPDMQVECAVVAARADDGIVSLDPGLIFRSKEVDLSAYGQINLKNEKLSIDFNNRPRKGLGISAASVVNPFVAVTGTLAKPKLGLDITSSAISGGAAVASAGVTIIAKPLFDRVFNRSDPCKAALEEWHTPPG